MPGTLEFAIHTLVQTPFNASIFDCRHKNDETACPAYNPKILLKVVLLAYIGDITFDLLGSSDPGFVLFQESLDPSRLSMKFFNLLVCVRDKVETSLPLLSCLSAWICS